MTAVQRTPPFIRYPVCPGAPHKTQHRRWPTHAQPRTQAKKELDLSEQAMRRFMQLPPIAEEEAPPTTILVRVLFLFHTCTNPPPEKVKRKFFILYITSHSLTHPHPIRNLP